METIGEAIRNISFFSGLSREDLARVVGKLQEGRFAAGQVIVRQGEIGDALYIIQSGSVEVVLEHDGLRVESVAILGPYECFGEMSLFTGQRRSASVIALIDAVVLKLHKGAWDELLAQHPSLSLHFCRVLSERLAETDQDILKGRTAFILAMEEFFAAQPAPIQDFLVRTSILKTLDPGAIESVLSVGDPNQILADLSLKHPVFLRIPKGGNYEYLDYLRDFLSAKLDHKIGRKERDELNLRLASYFSSHEKWTPAIHHYIKAEAWKEAIELIKAHGATLLEGEPPEEILRWLDALPLQFSQTQGILTRLRAEAHVRRGDLDSAIRSYQQFLAQKQVSVIEALETAGYYHDLSELYHKKGETGEALGCLRLGLHMLEEGKVNLDAVQAIHSIGLLQQNKGLQEAALRWGIRAFNVAMKLGAQSGPSPLPWNRKSLGFLLALFLGLVLWRIPPPNPLDEKGTQFLAVLGAGLILWIFQVFDEYVVAILMLLIWLLFGVVSPEMALAGFAKSSWFFVFGVLGIGAAVIKSGLLYRVALQVLRRCPPSYRLYTLILSASGFLVTPILTKSQGRLGIIAPISWSISENMGYKPRSNGSAGLALSAYIGFSQLSFMFLTGSTACMVGLNLLPESAKADFGWATWTVAALPAGIIVFLFLLLAVHYFFQPSDQDRVPLSRKTLEIQLEILGSLTPWEWLSLVVLVLAVAGWLGKPLHGISESWVALGALSAFFVAGVLDKNGLKNNIDWGYLIFLGVLSNLAVIIPHLKIDRWLLHVLEPILTAFSFHHFSFLMAVILLVYIARFLLSKTTTVILFLLALIPWSQDMGIHPGVLLLTILLANEAWFLTYQTDSYQIAYYSTEEKAFSHAQARKLMVAKFIASLLALVVSVPYWKMLGFIS